MDNPRSRIRAVAEGAAINTTYKMLPIPALDAFRKDLLEVLNESTYPTEDAYLAACRALHWRDAQLRAHGIELFQIPTGAPQYPAEDFNFISEDYGECRMLNCHDPIVMFGLCKHHWDWLNGR